MATEEFLLQRGGRNWSRSDRSKITKLPDEILLLIFEFYRQSFGQLPNSERDWNNKNGWFKLAHVCSNWRCVVLSSSFPLQLRLYFADKTPTRAAVLTRLPPLPIVVDYLNYNIVWNVSAHTRLASALKNANRVCRIAIAISSRSSNTFSNALDIRFPILESLEISNQELCEFRIPPTFLMYSTKRLRRLNVRARLESLSPLLSATMALIDLTLSINLAYPQLGASLLPLLQCLPCLRHLDLHVHYFHLPPAHATSALPTNIISLAELIHFRFKSHSPAMEEFMARLVTPSLQDLHVSLFRAYPAEEFQIPHLTKFMRNAGTIFVAAQLKFILESCQCKLSLLTPIDSVDDPSFNVIGIGPFSIARISSALSALLATVEEVFFAFRSPAAHARLSYWQAHFAAWCAFFVQLPNVKILRVQHGMETNVANMLRPGIGQPMAGLPGEEVAGMDTTTPSDMPVDSSQFNLAFLPSLEGIEVYMKSPDTSIPEIERASALEPFETLFAARRQARRVRVYWNTDQVLPASFFDEHTRGWSK